VVRGFDHDSGDDPFRNRSHLVAISAAQSQSLLELPTGLEEAKAVDDIYGVIFILVLGSARIEFEVSILLILELGRPLLFVKVVAPQGFTGKPALVVHVHLSTVADCSQALGGGQTRCPMTADLILSQGGV
jgi:hypothetical protein